jgi:hypothetical protein
LALVLCGTLDHLNSVRVQPLLHPSQCQKSRRLRRKKSRVREAEKDAGGAFSQLMGGGPSARLGKESANLLGTGETGNLRARFPGCHTPVRCVVQRCTTRCREISRLEGTKFVQWADPSTLKTPQRPPRAAVVRRLAMLHCCCRTERTRTRPAISPLDS